MGSRSLPNILVTGTPGTGKSTFCELIQTQLSSMKHIDVNKIAQKEGFHEGFDEKRHAYVIDEDKVCDELEDRLSEGGFLVDTHSMIDYFPERWFDLVLVLQTDNTILYDRLVARGYSSAKVQENVQCEIMRVLAEEARESYDENIVQFLDSNSMEDLEGNVDRTCRWIAQWIQNNEES